MSELDHGSYADVGDLVQLIRPNNPDQGYNPECTSYGFGLVVDVQRDSNRWLHILGQRYRVRASHTKIISRLKE